MKREEALQTAYAYKQALQAAGIPIVSVIIFGSVARNTMHDQSDIDIAVIGNPYKENRMEEQYALSKLRRGISYRIQPIWLYPEHLDNTYSTLAQEIHKDGLVV
jgi:predicted nucleotidyltransferase